jgi:hypothetical protein
MKNLYTAFISILLTATMFAQSPQKMSYQAVIRNSSDQLVNNHAVGMKVSILQGSATGPAVYVETQTPTSNANGLVTIEVGGGTPVTGTFAGIDWSTGTYFIKTETDPNGGTSYSITGTSQLLSVPYSLFAKRTGEHYIGELYGGGIVVAVWKVTGIEHGLIASLTDISTATTWSNIIDTKIGISAQSLTYGQANTNAIISQSGHTSSAAKLCDDYTNTDTGTGIYSDWYLPAIWELNQCYNAAFIVNTILGATNGFKFYTNGTYCSSTEVNDWYAYDLIFGEDSMGGDIGILDKGGKDDTFSVRAVRRF